MLVEWLLSAVLLAFGVRVLGGRERATRALALLMLTCAGALAIGQGSRQAPSRPQPIAERGDGFVTSRACRSCHPAEYASWHQSFHRSMTQNAATSTVAADELRRAGPLRLQVRGRTTELWARGDELWARLPDPQITSAAPASAYEEAFRAAPLREMKVQLLTGSHHQQAFWVAGSRPGELVALPVVYLIDEGRLIARHDAFLNPPTAPEHAVRWNSNCVQCHAVAGAPGHDTKLDAFATSAAELGIACEACHARGAEHVKAMRDPLARHHAARGGADLAIVNPARLSPESASQICGRCHSYFYPRDEGEWWQHGFSRSFSPGQDLSRAQLLLSPEVLSEADAPILSATAASLFYQDGTIRVGGREYNGLVRSPCYERGKGQQQLSCLSCHSLHQGAPDDQLSPEKLGNRACSGCHAAYVSNVTAHSHHSASSAGSLCYNCHMPHTSYALLGAIRSHRIDSPAFDASTRDKPNACNLCHLERSEAWAAAQARAWYGGKSRFSLDRTPERADFDVPAGAAFALSGDAAVRAVAAAALGRQDSAVAGRELRAELLAKLGRDDYAAVRAVAERSLARLHLDRDSERVLPEALVRSLLAARDEQPVTIAE